MSIPPLPFKVKTKVSWAGEEDGDLGFIENEVVEVYSIVDDSWWSGKLRRNNAEGIFPKDYVEVIEDSLPHSSSSRSISQLPSKQNTPVKDNDYERFKSSKNNTPVNSYYNKSKIHAKKINPLNNPDISYDDEYDYSFDNSYENVDPRMSRSNGYLPQKKSSYTRLSPNGKMMLPQQQASHEELMEVHTPAQAQKEKELAQLKVLQHQYQLQSSQMRKQQLDQQKRSRQQQHENYRNSMAVTPDYQYHASANAKQKINAAKQRPISSYNQYADNSFSSPSPAPAFGFSPPYQGKSSSYTDMVDSSQKLPAAKYPMFPNHTVESFAPDAAAAASHPGSSRRRNAQNFPTTTPDRHLQNFYDPLYDTEPPIIDDGVDDPVYEELAITKHRLELELQRIKQIEKKKKSAMKSPPQSASINKQIHDPIYGGRYSVDSSYVSEDLLSSKKHQSRDDLGKKLSHYVTDEENDHQHYGDVVDDETPYHYGGNGMGSNSPMRNRSPSPPPPPPPKHEVQSGYGAVNGTNNQYGTRNGPYDTNGYEYPSSPERQKYSNADIYRMSDMSQEELKQSIKSLQSDVLNLSELSSTSAGSFNRHKEAKLRQAEEKMNGLSLHEECSDEDNEEARDKMPDKSVMDAVFEDRRKPNIFQKFLHKRKGADNLVESSFQDEEMDWMALKTSLNRMNSLSTHDKQTRTRRTVREESSLIIKPLDYVGEANVNETTEQLDDDDQVLSDFMELSFKKTDSFIERYDIKSDFNELISDISVKFNSSKVNQLRCVLLHLCKFRVIEEPSKIMQIKPKLAEVLYKGEASIYQLNYLFKKILDALRIRCELVLGFWKKPNEFYHIEQYIVNHCWLSVALEGKIYIMDLYNFKNGSVCNLKNVSHNYNEYYFLTKPLSVISTHIPSIIDLQHVIPPVDQTIAFYLPRQYSGFHKSRLHIRSYNNALTRLKDLEIFEFEIDIPNDIELFTLIKTAKVTTNELSLCQVFWRKNSRIAKIKAVLPEKESIGVLQVFAGPKGLQEQFENIHELAVVIPLYHTGTSKPGKFVPRFPSGQSQNNDLYIKQPQTNKIVAKNSYIFEIMQHPSMGLNSGSGLMNQDFKLIIKSPSGKHYRLIKDDLAPYGTYEVNIKCQELGTYTGLVIGDSGNSWTVFAQWECVASSSIN